MYNNAVEFIKNHLFWKYIVNNERTSSSITISLLKQTRVSLTYKAARKNSQSQALIKVFGCRSRVNQVIRRILVPQNHNSLIILSRRLGKLYNNILIDYIRELRNVNITSAIWQQPLSATPFGFIHPTAVQAVLACVVTYKYLLFVLRAWMSEPSADTITAN